MRRRLLGGLAVVAILRIGAPGLVAQGPSSATTNQPLGAISGIVVDAVTKRPVRGAIVTLGPAVLIGTGSRQLTDDRGRFIFAGLPAANNYTLQAGKAGYLDRSNLVRPRPFPLAPGQWLANRTVEIIPEGSISGAVLDERGEPVVGVRVRLLAVLLIAGRIHHVAGPVATTDDRGVYRFAGLPEGRYMVSVPSVQHAVPAGTPPAAIAGTAVSQASADAVSATARGLAQPTLEFDGNRRLLIGGYATPPPPDAAGRPQAYPATFHANAQTLAEGTTIALAAGQERDGVDVQLRPVQTWRITGRVTSPAAKIAGLPLRLLPGGQDDLGPGSEAATTLVEGDGRFTFLNVPAGRYALDLRPSLMAYDFSPRNRFRDAGDPLPPAPGSIGGGTSSFGGRIDAAPLGTSYSSRTGGWDQTVWARVEIEVSDRDQIDLAVPLQPLGRLRGRVVWERTTDAALPSPPPASPPGTPLSVQDGIKQTVIGAQSADGSLRLGQPSGVMAADGTFAIDGMFPAQYVLRVRGPLGMPFSIKSIVWQGVDYTHAAIDATGTAEIADVVITLIDRTQSVTGVVSGMPPDRGTAVIAFPVDARYWTNYGLQPSLIRTTVASGDGAYQLTLPAGDFYLVAVDESQIKEWTDPAFLQAASRVATRVPLTWGETRTQALRFTPVTR